VSARTITLKENILGANREKAVLNRTLLNAHQIRMINVLSAPGSGKTSLILRAIDRFRGQYRIAVIKGDVASSIDADRFLQQNIPALQINTGGGCHLDAPMIHKALLALDLEPIDLIFLENIGNLVCAADFDLGAHRNVVVLSVPEGDDKARKFPIVFIEAAAVLVNKIDVMPFFDFRLDAFSDIVHGLNPTAPIYPVSAKTGEGLDNWFSWIEETLQKANGV
jgi:hydrogenase nickel incorporation protein HypB